MVGPQGQQWKLVGKRSSSMSLLYPWIVLTSMDFIVDRRKTLEMGQAKICSTDRRGELQIEVPPDHLLRPRQPMTCILARLWWKPFHAYQGILGWGNLERSRPSPSWQVFQGNSSSGYKIKFWFVAVRIHFFSWKVWEPIGDHVIKQFSLASEQQFGHKLVFDILKLPLTILLLNVPIPGQIAYKYHTFRLFTVWHK